MGISDKPKEISDKTKEIVKATAPVLAEHGYTITTTMYGKMLKENPKVSELFNPSHQIVLPGETKARQPAVLAASVHAYAANIDNLSVLKEAVERIAQKHVSLYILPEHYPIVGENLLWAIKEVLGDAATPDIMEAWKEAYFFLADILIAREKELRESKAAHEGGWEGWRPFVVDRKVKESVDITSFYLKPQDGKDILTFQAGQYTAIRIETPEFVTQRNYTISCSPGQSTYRITVKREPNGKASNWLHDEVEVGGVLKLGVPSGDFVLNLSDSKPIVLLSGGVGLTPAVSMLEHLVETKKSNKIYMVHSTRNPDTEAMHDVIASYKSLNIFVKTLYSEGTDEDTKGRISMEKLNDIVVDRDAHYYFCGPPGFMKTIYQGLKKEWQIPEEQIHFELFGPHSDLIE